MNNQRSYAYDDQGVNYSQSNAPAGGDNTDYPYTSQMYHQQQGGQYYAPPRQPPTSAHGNPDPRYARSATPAAGHRYSRSSVDPRYYHSSGLSSSSTAGAPPSPTVPYYTSQQYPSTSGRHTSSSQSGQGRFFPTPSEMAQNYTYSSTLPDQQPSQSPSMYATPGHHSRRHPSTSPVLSTSRLNPMRSHSSTSPTSERYPCELCGKTFSRSHDRKRHHETQHIPSPVLHRCRYCRKEFSRADSLKRHLDNGCEEMPQASGSGSGSGSK